MANLHETIACRTLEDEPSSNIICVHCFLLLLNIPTNSYSQVCTASYFVGILPDIGINDILSPATNCIIKCTSKQLWVICRDGPIYLLSLEDFGLLSG